METTSKAVKLLNWLADEPKFQYTLGSLITKAAGQNPKELGVMPMGRAGRAVERTVTLGGGAAAFSLMVGFAGLTPLYLFPLAIGLFCFGSLIKIAGSGLGLLTDFIVQGRADKIERDLCRSKHGIKSAAKPEHKTAPEKHPHTLAHKGVNMSLAAVQAAGAGYTARFNSVSPADKDAGKVLGHTTKFPALKMSSACA